MKKLTLFIFFTISLIYSKNATGQWVNIADLPNSHFGDIQFFDENLGFIIGDEFIYKTFDGGYTWTATQLGESLDILHEFDFIDADTGYIVGDVSGAQGFYTVNSGESWLSKTPHNVFGQVAMINGNEVVVGRYPPDLEIFLINFSEASVLSLMPGGGLGGQDIIVFPEDTIYVGGGGFAKSFDKGENWIITEMPGILYMHFPTSKTGYSTFEDLLYKTTNYGDTWESLEIPIYFNACGALEFTNDSVGYYPCSMDGDFYGIMKTTDGGGSWILNEFDTELEYLITGISCIDPYSCWCITYDGQVFYTDNGGGETQPPVAIIENSEINFSISPNPVSDIFTLQINESIEQSEITFVNTTGQSIPFKIIDNNDGQLIIDIKLIPSGLYFLNYESFSAKIIKL